ncbi:MAG: hypothetical protein A2Y57_00830 [Candidatus Woykebacteria bacterium RBG_13_40_7b]|uniref:F5/8 type C domain-containing protein n=1 Tax=Candidatus Woykebacteria bacterium RBG_13_40_7b TaxID=1802594 RepID=A0A1G1WAV3_9BACT|nr:MAG: hypothetical protein A2Y57_00830 [Candidatus Woykebacteria bacterium RBG_13_40_7b]
MGIFELLTFILLSLVLILVGVLFLKKNIEHELVPPELKNNPSYDVIMTELTPLISFTNAKGGIKHRKYEIEIDKSKNFDSEDKIIFSDVEENGEFVTDIKIKKEKPLSDKTQYYWRVRTIGPGELKSKWEVSRFFVDTESDDHFMDLTRAEIKEIEVSGGYNAKNIIDYDDPGLVTFWQSPPPGKKEHWMQFDFGKPREVTRLWVLSNPDDADGWLKDFVLQSSIDGKVWDEVKRIEGNDTFRNIIDFSPVETRYFRILIKEFIGYAAQINEVIIYSTGKPAIPDVPEEDYVLIIGNEHNGFTFTDLKKYIENLGYQTILLPYFEASLEMLNSLNKKPFAIVLSGNNADYPNLPMFEHNGEFEIIRESFIPILGICAGHQFLAMAYGYSRARSMGWSDITAIEPKTKWAHIKIFKKDPVFEGIKNAFTAPEIHGWAVVEPAEEFEVIAKSKYIQVQKSNKRLIYGIQFHSEIDVPYNEGKKFIENFLRLAKEKNV